MSWTLKIWLVAVGGAVFGLLWPYIVAAIRGGPGPKFGIGQFTNSSTGKALVWGLAVLVASAVVVSLGFAGFLGDAENRKALEDAGGAAFFLLFTFGFGAAALVEEPLRKTS